LIARRGGLWDQRFVGNEFDEPHASRLRKQGGFETRPSQHKKIGAAHAAPISVIGRFPN
jgi:hypothetical protein